LTLLASLSRQELAQQVRYLKAENQTFHSKLPTRITLDNRERRSLVKHGMKLGGKIKEVMSIVSYSTSRRWVRLMEDGPSKTPTATVVKPKSKVAGRPRTDDEIRDTIIRIRKETGFGYTKVRPLCFPYE
jgi:putative transposase